MADEPSEPPPPANQAAPRPPIPRTLSAIFPDDLGLKAGYWTTKPGDPVTFLEIVGWVTVMNWESLVGGLPFLPVVLNDVALPVYAERLPNFIAVFAKSSTAEEALVKAGSWLKNPGGGADDGGGMVGGGAQGRAPN